MLQLEDQMNEIEKAVLDKFKALLLERVSLHRLILFGSRARREAGPFSDMDVVVILAGSSKEDDFDYVSDCAWEAGFEYGIVIVPVVFTREAWENNPERHSLLAQAIEAEGVAV
jgi:predicted nucleotidyltransferase